MALKGGQKAVVGGVSRKVGNLAERQLPLLDQHTSMLNALLHQRLFEAIFQNSPS